MNSGSESMTVALESRISMQNTIQIQAENMKDILSKWWLFRKVSMAEPIGRPKFQIHVKPVMIKTSQHSKIEIT